MTDFTLTSGADVFPSMGEDISGSDRILALVARTRYMAVRGRTRSTVGRMRIRCLVMRAMTRWMLASCRSTMCWMGARILIW